MKSKNLLAAFAIAATAAFAGMAQAATVSVDVYARQNSVVTLNGADTGITLSTGDAFKVSAATDDLWRIGFLTRHEGNADGMVVQRPKTLFGQTFNHGTLVGRIGDGAFFRIGTLFEGIAERSGVLRLFAWDINTGDNSGFVTANIEVSPVPLPAGAPLMLAGLAALGLLRRRKA